MTYTTEQLVKQQALITSMIGVRGRFNRAKNARDVATEEVTRLSAALAKAKAALEEASADISRAAHEQKLMEAELDSIRSLAQPQPQPQPQHEVVPQVLPIAELPPVDEVPLVDEPAAEPLPQRVILRPSQSHGGLKRMTKEEYEAKNKVLMTQGEWDEQRRLMDKQAADSRAYYEKNKKLVGLRKKLRVAEKKSKALAATTAAT